VERTSAAPDPTPPARRSPAAGGEAFDLARPYRLDPQVAIRPEPFGALAYHYGNRRLTFLRAPELIPLLRSLADHPSAQAALDASGFAAARRPGVVRALASLERSEVIVAR
jgi:putative mycofactocin binding protein MftB